MPETLPEHLATFKSNLADAATAGHGEVAVVMQHGIEHLLAAAKNLHPDIPAIENEVKPFVAELVTYAFSLIPGAPWVSFLEPRVNDFVNHEIDLGLKKLFPAAT